MQAWESSRHPGLQIMYNDHLFVGYTTNNSGSKENWRQTTCKI